MYFYFDAWVLLYLINLLLISLALGSLTFQLPRALPLPGHTRFLIGFCLAPFATGLWMLVLAAVAPGAGRVWFILPPPLLSIGVLLALARRIVPHGRRVLMKVRLSHRWTFILTSLAAAGVAGIVLIKLITLAGRPVIGFDALQYLGETYTFAEKRSLASLNGFRDAPDGTRRGDIHGPLWPAFLAHSLLHTGDDHLGYPYDQATRAAFQVTMVYMGLSVLALAGALRQPGTGALALILLALAPQFGSVANSSGRDAFRIIPLMLLAALLAGLSPARLQRSFPVAAWFFLALFSALSLAGHALGALAVIGLFLAWWAWHLVMKTRWSSLVFAGLAVGAGLILGGTHYIQAYLETGRLMGDQFYNDAALAGTPLEQANQKIEKDRLEGTETLGQRVSLLLARDGYRLSIPGLLAALFTIAWLLNLKSPHRRRPIVLFGLTVLASTLPVLGAFDLFGFKFSEWFVRNFRYAVHWYGFAAVLLAGLLTWGRSVAEKSGNDRSGRAWRAGFALFTISAAFLAIRTVNTSWTISTWEEAGFAEDIAMLQDTLEQLPEGKNLLLDDLKYNYYLGNRAVLLYSFPTWPLIQARSEGEAGQALDRLKIGSVALMEKNISGWWDRIPLYDYLAGLDGQYQKRSNGSLRVYRSTPFIPTGTVKVLNSGFEEASPSGWGHWSTLRAWPEPYFPHTGRGAGCFRTADGETDLPWIITGGGGYGHPPEERSSGAYMLHPATDYRVSLWARAHPDSIEAAAIFVYIQQFAANGLLTEDFLDSMTVVTEEYRPLVASFRSAAEVESFRLLVRAGDAGERVCIDDVQVEQIEYLPVH
jgi:hypothetical protein